MQKKEYYKYRLPHFQQPGQAYFVTWSLKDAFLSKALNRYTNMLELLKNQIGFYENSEMSSGSKSTSPDIDTSVLRVPNCKKDASVSEKNQRFGNCYSRLKELKKEYYSTRKKYIKAYNDLLDLEKGTSVNLAKPQNAKVISDALKFWEGKRLKNYAYCIMPNHVHWAFELLEKDEEGNPVYLQDIMYSVKRFTANQINKLEKRTGSLWQKESFDRTIRDEKHLYNTVEYTLNNSVSAGLVEDRKEWEGCWCAEWFAENR